MFTGIIESMGQLMRKELSGTNVDFWFRSSFTNELKVDQSLAHNGVCLTVVEIKEDQYRVTAIEETLLKTNIGDLSVDSKVNLERCMPANGRFDGHIVQGHVDQTAVLTKVEERDGSWNYFFDFNNADQALVVPKGSITVNGTSLTVVEASKHHFSVSIIPYTYHHTVFHTLKRGDLANIEFDILGKYALEATKRALAGVKFPD
jgi:riboflavin synthase